MPIVAKEPAYETVGEARQISVDGWRIMARVKASAKLALVALGVLVLVAAGIMRRGGAPGPARAPTADVSFDFQVKSFPGDCRDLMRYEGCQKKAWTCEEDASPWKPPAYRCCCDMSIWQVPQNYQQQRSPVQSLPMHHGGADGASVLRLQKTTNLCLAGPEDVGSHFTFASCGDSNTRFKLPPRGAGPIQLADQPGQCLGVAKGSLKNVQVMPCNQGSMEQMFQLTNGDKGMLQWSHGGNKCLDSENGSPESGSKIALADCVYWPLKPSQTFVLEDAPKKVAREEEEKDKKEKKEKKEHKREAEGIHPSLFCTSLMLPWSYEVDMLRSHIEKKIGIFACTGWAVYSNEKVRLKEGATPDDDVYCNVMEGSLKAKIGGKFHTALNTPVFQRFWKKLMDDGRVWDYDWTIKVDPDCVFFPSRLTEMLKTQYHPHGTWEEPVWLNNCQLGLHGPLEVFNKAAFKVFKDAGDDACDDVAEEHGQEDVFLRHCFMKLGVPKQDAFNLLLESEWACNERPAAVSTQMPPCYDRQVSFHPFKSVKGYFACYDKAVKMSWNTPLIMNSVPPSSANHHSA